MIAILQTITRWIKTFRGSHLHSFCDNFAVAYGVQKTTIRREAMQLLRKIAMFCAEHNIKIQTH